MALLYSLYGVCLGTDIPVPGLVPSTADLEPDVEVRLRETPGWVAEAAETARELVFSSPYRDERGVPTLLLEKMAGGAYIRLAFCDGTEFLLDRRGTRICATWPDGLTLEDATTYLVGPVMGFLLRLRGVTPLHASAVSVENQAIALVGPRGAGKSTTAAAFATRGVQVLSDDILALHEQDGTFLVHSGYPRLCLWPSSVDALYGSEDVLPRITPTWDKRYLDVIGNGHHFQQEAIPLGAIYLLGDRSEDSAAPFTQALRARDGLLALVANTYANRLLDPKMRAREFQFLSRVLERVPVRQVNAHQNPHYLPKLCDVILQDFQALARPAPAFPVANPH